MKILVGLDSNSESSKISKRFGRAKYYAIFDTELNKIEYFTNNDEHIHEHDDDDEEHDHHHNHEHHGGHSGHHHHVHHNLSEFVNLGVNVVIAGHVGPHAYETLAQPGVEVFTANNLTFKEAIEKFNNNELVKISKPTLNKSIHRP